MTCPQCSAELLDSATFCYKCGSAIRPATFSYLPAGAPPWPTTIAEMPLYRSGSTAQSMEQGETLPAAKIVQKPKRSARGVILMVAIFLLTPVVAVGATLGTLWYNGQLPISTTTHATVSKSTQPTPGTSGSLVTPTAQGNQLPTPTSFQTANSSQVGVSLKYPSGWVADAAQVTTNSSALGFHPQQQDGIYISVERITAKSSATIGSTSQLNQSNLAQFQNAQGIVNFQTVPAATPQRTIGGAQWDEQDASFSNANNVPFHLTTIAVQHNHLYYDILFYSPQTYYDEAMQKYFQPMFDSFQFQS